MQDCCRQCIGGQRPGECAEKRQVGIQGSKSWIGVSEKGWTENIAQKIEALKEYYNRKLNAQYDCKVDKANSDFL